LTGAFLRTDRRAAEAGAAIARHLGAPPNTEPETTMRGNRIPDGHVGKIVPQRLHVDRHYNCPMPIVGLSEMAGI
jgi:hypothetical protein